jgi:hypothetical protein
VLRSGRNDVVSFFRACSLFSDLLGYGWAIDGWIKASGPGEVLLPTLRKSAKDGAPVCCRRVEEEQATTKAKTNAGFFAALKNDRHF